MYFQEKEYNGFSDLYCFINTLYRNKTVKTAVFKLVYKDKVVSAKYDTMYDSDNGLDLDDPNFDEYHEIAFVNVETNEWFGINYANLPDEIYCDGKRVI